MIIQCKRCNTRFKVPDDKISGKGTKVRCSRCSLIFKVAPPGGRQAGDEASAPAARSGSPRAPRPSGPSARALAADPQSFPDERHVLLSASKEDDPFAHLDLKSSPLGQGLDRGSREAASLGPPPLTNTGLPALSSLTPDEARSRDREGIQLGSGQGPGEGPMEIEKFGGDHTPGRGHAPRSRSPRAEGTPRASRTPRSGSGPRTASSEELGLGMEGRMVSFGEEDPEPDAPLNIELKGIRGDAAQPSPSAFSTPACPSEDHSPQEEGLGRRSSRPRSPLPDTPGEQKERSWRPRGPAPALELDSLPRASVSISQRGTTAVVSRTLTPPLGVPSLGTALIILLLLNIFAVFVLARNGWQIDLRRPAHAMSVAFGRAPRELVVDERPARLVGVKQCVYATRNGRDIFLVEGEILNVGKAPLRKVRITVRLLDKTDNRVLDSREVPGGGWLDPAQLRGLTSPASLHQTYVELDRKSASLVIRPGERAPFIAVFVNLPPSFPTDAFTFDVRVTELDELSHDGS